MTRELRTAYPLISAVQFDMPPLTPARPELSLDAWLKAIAALRAGAPSASVTTPDEEFVITRGARERSTPAGTPRGTT